MQEPTSFEAGASARDPAEQPTRRAKLTISLLPAPKFGLTVPARQANTLITTVGQIIVVALMGVGAPFATLHQAPKARLSSGWVVALVMAELLLAFALSERFVSAKPRGRAERRYRELRRRR